MEIIKAATRSKVRSEMIQKAFETESSVLEPLKESLIEKINESVTTDPEATSWFTDSVEISVNYNGPIEPHECTQAILNLLDKTPFDEAGYLLNIFCSEVIQDNMKNTVKFCLRAFVKK